MAKSFGKGVKTTDQSAPKKIRLLSYLRGNRKEVLLGPVFKFTEAVFELFSPLVLADLIDNVLKKNGTQEQIWLRCGLMLLLTVLGFCFALICQFSASKASQGFGTRLRDDLFAHCATLSERAMNRFGSAALVTRLSQDTVQLQVLVAMSIRLVVRAPFLVLGAIIMSFLLAPQLAWIFLAATILLSLLLGLILRISVPLHRKAGGLLDKLGRRTAENTAGARVIRAFNRQEEEKAAFDQEAEEFRALTLRLGKLEALISPGIFLILNAATVLLLLLGGKSVAIGTVQQGTILALVNYMAQISTALVVVANLMVMIPKGLSAGQRVREILATESELTEGGEDTPLDSDEALVFEQVRLSYTRSEDEAALTGLSFTAKRGAIFGIIGGTGSGKSTLLALSQRFYDPDAGRILLFGRPIGDYTFAALRRLVAVLPQKAALFGGTIRENLTLGIKEDQLPAEDALWSALAAASIAETVRKKGGLDAPVLPLGRNFSGGQKQRLCLARAFARNAPLLLLDDPFSALDATTAAAVRAHLEQLKNQGTTILLVSQRYQTLQQADKILCLSDGLCVGLGTHETLLRDCPFYAALVRSQQDSREEGATA